MDLGDGVVLIEDDAFDADDIEAQQTLDAYIVSSGASTRQSSSNMEGMMYAKGNAVVYEFAYTVALTEDQEEELAERVSELDTFSGSIVSGIRSESGVKNAVVIYAYLSVDGRLIASTIASEE